jgi:hypothetical protein
VCVCVCVCVSPHTDGFRHRSGRKMELANILVWQKRSERGQGNQKYVNGSIPMMDVKLGIQGNESTRDGEGR